MRKQLSIDDIAEFLTEYEISAEHYADTSADTNDMIAWNTHAVAARRIRKELFELVGEVDPKAVQNQKDDQKVFNALNDVFRSSMSPKKSK